MYSQSYLPLGAGVAGAVTAGTTSDPAAGKVAELAGSLPFTGLSVLWLLLAAVALIALGGAVRRLVPARQA
jgi:hypothetical protein